jgi:hypothetical protein
MSPQKLHHQTLCLLNRRGTEDMPLARPNMRITIELPLGGMVSRNLVSWVSHAKSVAELNLLDLISA